jgi:hypothetical protein
VQRMLSKGPILQSDAAEDNTVTSFECGIVTFQGAWVGMCIKFSHFDHSATTTHWPPVVFQQLMEALEQYMTELGANAFIFRATNAPELVESLPVRHPYLTLLSEKPKLTNDEVGTTRRATSVETAVFSLRGPTFEIRATYHDGHQQCIFMHEYTALSLLGYLQQYLKAATTLSGPAAGRA